MIRRVVLLGLLGTLLLPTSPATAGPADRLCDSDTTRGAVPADFLLEACVDGAGVTVRNSLDIPVVVTGYGMDEPVRISSAGEERDTVLRLVHENTVVLVPGDVVRWPTRRGEAAVAVTDLEPADAPAIVETLDPFLPREGPRRIPDTVLQAFAEVVAPIADAVAARTTCLEGRNFLGAVACDVTTASAIASALDRELSRGVAAEVAPAVLDGGQWAEWAGIPTTQISGSTAVLRQAAVPPPALAPASVSRSSRPTPAPAPAPPAPAPAPAPSPAPAPQTQTQTTTPSTNGNGNGRGNANGHDRWDAWWDDVAAWLEAND